MVPVNDPFSYSIQNAIDKWSTMG